MSRNNDAAEAVSHAGDRVRDKAAEVTENVRDIGNKVRDAASDTYGQVREKTADYINQGKDYIHQGTEAAEEWEKSLETYVQEKPLQAVLLAAGLGLLIGLLWKRR